MGHLPGAWPFAIEELPVVLRGPNQEGVAVSEVAIGPKR
jgi:hypothetical protein